VVLFGSESNGGEYLPVRLNALLAAPNGDILYINTVMRIAITPLRAAGIRLKQNVENLADGQQIREVAQTRMVSLS
jgi:hypothetical protein